MALVLRQRPTRWAVAGNTVANKIGVVWLGVGHPGRRGVAVGAICIASIERRMVRRANNSELGTCIMATRTLLARNRRVIKLAERQESGGGVAITACIRRGGMRCWCLRFAQRIREFQRSVMAPCTRRGHNT